MEPTKENPGIILFDGICNLCNYWVNFIIDHDPDGKFKFASLQSVSGENILKQFFFPGSYPDSIILIFNDETFQKSRAVIEIGTRLNGVIKIIWLLRIIPYPILNVFYDLIAHSRYRIFGKLDSCRIPTPEIMERFI